MDDFVQIESQMLNKLFDFVSTNQLSPITHWNEINIGKPVKGMTEDECLLAFGKPQTISESNGEVQWMYSSSFYLFFKNGCQFGDVVRTCAKIDGKVLFGAVTVLGGLERCFDEFVYRRIVRLTSVSYEDVLLHR